MKNFIATLLIIASLGLFYMYISPAYDEILALRQKKSEYDEAINNSQKIQAFRDELLNKYNSFAPANLQRLNKLLPNHIENIRLIIEIDSIASRHNMTLKNVQITLPVDRSPGLQDAPNEALQSAPSLYGTANFSFEVSGSYVTYRSFVNDIEKNLRLIDITGISLSTEKDGASGQKTVPETYTFKTSGQTYWLK